MLAGEAIPCLLDRLSSFYLRVIYGTVSALWLGTKKHAVP